ncbi:autotransporter-associated beta strand repeat-containing protein [Sphingomonas sp. Root241]|uniref:autotransporter-associated beta strand repeat-containing protein n=1 Tax=Sphingomonas sp. Root241 TaxID=1736501 RepID=UPI0006FD3B8B|nr:autotransporter-associated beta strand repeat-containing protein [Sphingomonas sp. Root241]KRC81475.1 hypothetical protein ASE13_03530 [Sphingomonas sp. Root241]
MSDGIGPIGQRRAKCKPARLLCGASLSALALFALPSVAHAQGQDRYWDANGTATGSGGNGDWNTSVPVWSESNSDVLGPYRTWNNAALDNAIFGITAAGTTTTVGTVTLTEPITVHNMTFQSVHNWVLNGNTLTLAGTTPTVNAIGNTTINSIVAGTNGLTKTGSGQLFLTGTNTFSGGITLSAGQLAADDDAALGAAGNAITTTAGSSTGLVINSGTSSRTVTIGAGATLGVNGVGTGGMLYTGSGNLNVGLGVTLSNNNSNYTGVTRFFGCNGVCATSFTSIADLGVASSLGAPTTVANGTIQWGQQSQYEDYLLYLGDGDSSNRNWNVVANGAFVRNDGTGTLTLTGDVALAGSGGGFMLFWANTADVAVTGVLGSAAGGRYQFNPAAGRTVTLGAANTFTGQAILAGGGNVIVPVMADNGVASSLGAGSTIALSNGHLIYTGAVASSNRNWTSDNANSIENNGTGSLGLSGNLAFTAGGTDNLTLGGTFAGTNTISGVISGTGNLIGDGGGTWSLTGANTRTGTVTVNNGTLQVGSASALGTLTGVTVNGGTLDLNGFGQVFPTLNGTGGQVALGSANLTINAAVNSSYAGSITGTGGLTKAGAGIQTLSGASTYIGDTTILGGTLALNFAPAGGPASDIISSASTLNMSGGALTVTGATGEANTQSFDGLNITAGNNIIGAISGAGGSMTVNLGDINRTSGLINFNLPSSGNITTTDTVLGGWATVNGTDYAKVVGGNIVAFTPADYVDKDDASTWLAGEFISDSDGDPDSYFGTVGSSIQLGGLQFTTPDATTTVTVAAGQTLGVDGTIIVAPSVGANNQTITGGSLTGLSGGGGVLGIQQNGTGNFTIASQIVDNGAATGFTKAGTGLVTLTNAASSYTGATTVAQGILSVNSIANGGSASSIGASSAASSNLNIQGSTLRYTGGTIASDRGFTISKSGAILGGTVEVTNGAANLTFGGLVTSPDGASLTKIGAGTLTLANDTNNYTGITTVAGGILSVDTLANGGLVSGIGASSSASGNLVLTSSGTLQYTGATVSSDRGFTLGPAVGNSGVIDVANGASTLTLSGAAVGGGQLVKSGAGTLTLCGTNTYTGGTVVSAGTLRACSAQSFGTSGVTMANVAGATLDLNNINTTFNFLQGGGTTGGNVTLGTATLTLNGGNGTYSGAISGTGGVTRLGGGNQTLVGCNNSYTGPTIINGGIISTNCLANGGVNSGIGASTSAPANLQIGGSGWLSYTGGSVTTNRGIQLIGGWGLVDVANAATTLEFSGTATGVGGLYKNGPGTLVMSGNNTYTAGTHVQGGILRAGSATAFGTAYLQLADVAGAVLDLNGFNITTSQLLGGGNTGGNVQLGSGTLTVTSGDSTFAGIITGTGNFVKSGVNTQYLTGCNSNYTGTTTVSGGQVIVQCLTNGGANSSIGASSNAASNLVVNNALLTYIGTGNSTDRLMTVGGSAQIRSSGTGALNFTNTGALIFASPNTAQTVVLGGTNAGNNSFALQINNNGAGVTSFTKVDAGTWILTNPNSAYTGATQILGGVLGVDKLSNGGTGSSIGASSNAASNLIIGSGSTLRYTGVGDSTDRRFTLAVGSTFIESSGTGAVNFTNNGAVSYSGTGARVMALGGTNTGDNIMGATIGDQNAANITSLAKNDSGKWILTGTNSFTGLTNVNAGTLIIGNGGTAGSIVSSTINNAGVLGFNRSNTLTIGGNIQGTGVVQQLGTGTTVLTGTSTYTGGTTVAQGTLQLGNGGTTGSIVGNVVNNGTLAFNRSNIYSFGGTISGSGTVSQIGAGTTILTGTNSYSGGTSITAGTLQVSSDANLGAASGGLTINGGTLNTTASFTSGRATALAGASTFLTDPGTTLTLGGAVSGPGTLTKTGTGTLTLAADNSYTGGTTITAGTLQVGNGGATGSVLGNVLNNGALVFNRSGTLAMGGTIIGGGSVTQSGPGTTILAAANTYAGPTSVNAGTLLVNGNQAGATGLTTVASGATLGGTGTIGGGGVSVADGGTLAAGSNGVGVLAINGNLALGNASLLAFEFGQGNTPGGPLNDLVNVGGNLTLDGTVNVTQTAGGSFGPGVYRMFNYAGTLTNNGLAIGTMPPGSNVFVQTAVANQVNLANTAGLTLNFWDGAGQPKNDGAIQGGNGVWRLGGGANDWTEVSGIVNADYAQNSFAIFQSTGGTVTVDNGAGNVLAAGMQFTTDGYTIAGGPLTLTGADALVRVGDGSPADPGLTATVSAELAGSARLVKDLGGTLVLTGINTYTGGTAVNGGTLRIAGDANLGAASGGLSFNGGTLNTTATFTSNRAADLAGSGRFLTDTGTSLTLGGVISGAGALNKGGTGTLVLTAANNYAGGTTISAGTLQLGNSGATGSIVGDVIDNGALAFNRSDVATFAGAVSGSGTVSQSGAGTTILTGSSSYTGGTTISAGTLQIGNGGATGSIVGDVVDNATLAFNRSDAATFAGLISGTGGVNQIGAGTTTLTGSNSYSGTTTVGAGTLLINGDQAAATGPTGVASGATLGGTGTIGGDVTIAAGGILAPGGTAGPGTLAINGNLALAGGATLNYDFGQANTPGGALNDLVNVGGDISLDGTLNVTTSPGGTFGPGIYRVINYAGTLTDNSLAIGTIPAGTDFYVQTSVAHQVNLINTDGLALRFWDGAAGGRNDGIITGGDGIWQNVSGNDNWTLDDASINAPFLDSAFAIFGGAAGTVTVDQGLGAINVAGMQFATDGYRIEGDALNIVGPQAIVRVGDGSAAGAGYTTTIASVLAGAAELVKTDLGTLVLTGTNSYTGGTRINAGTLRISSDANLGDAAGGLSLDGGTLNTTADIAANRAANLLGAGTLLTDTGTTLTLTGPIAGAGGFTKDGAGTLVLTGANSYAGATAVAAGSLFVNGDQSAATGAMSIASGATLGGSGIIGGNVMLADGATLAAGTNNVGTLTINGDLALGSGSVLDFAFGQANVAGGALNDLVNVGGNLTLAGTINVSVPAGGSFGPGIFRVFNYGGALTDNGLTLGTMPGGSAVSVQTAVAGQVNLVNTAGLTLSFWDGNAGPKNDGAVNGGDGVWRVGGGTNNWTDQNGTVNADYAQNSFAIFSGPAGTVSVSNVGGDVLATGMQFASDGYVVDGGPLTLTGAQAIVQVGDGSAGGAGYTATIDAELTGAAGLTKTDAGTLVLTGTNSYTGGTTINGGTLRISADVNLGAAAGGITLGGGTLNTTADLTSSRAVNLAGAGTFLTDGGTTLTLDGAISGAGALTKQGAGSLVLTADSAYGGGTTIAAGMLQLGNGGTTGSITGDIVDNGALLLNRSDSLTLAGTITGSGSVSQIGSGTTILTGANSYGGGTTISAGILQLGAGGTTGSITGDVVDNAALVFDRSDQVTFANVISGTGRVEQAGPGTTILTGANTYTGGTTISAGTLQLGNGGTSGSIAGDVLDNGLLVLDRSDTMTFGGTISGGGALIQVGTGTTILTGGNSYTGATSVTAGTLLIEGDQSGATGLTSVVSGATLGGTGIVGGNVSVADGGTLAAGSNGVGALTINGNLVLGSGSQLAFEFGQASVSGGPLNDLVNVGGNLTLDGTIDVTQAPGGSFGPGVYRVINYAGTLTDNGLTVGSLPSGTAFVQTAVANQVNLVNTAGLTLNFWDGAAGPKNDGTIQGGNGIWVLGGGANNWTEVNGAVNADYAQGSFAIFQGTGGTVTVDNSGGNVLSAGMQFTVGGYTIVGQPLTLTGAQAFVRVGDGGAGDAAITTTVSSVLTGSAQLVKDMGGTLVLTGVNSYMGGTAINGGTLSVSSDANLGDAASGLSFNGGTLRTTGTFGSNRAVTLGGTGTFFTQGAGLVLGGIVSGPGALVKDGAGTLILRADHNYTGGTTITAGLLQLGEGGTTGSILGNVVNNARFAVNRSDTLTLAGTISGSGELLQTGTGTTILTAANSYTGATRVSAGTLLINGDQSAATGLTAVAANATLGGTGTLGGNVLLGDGTLAPGTGGPGTLTINGNLSMGAGAHLGFDFGAANAPGNPLNDVVNVGGDLTLDGTIDVAVTPGGAFDIGLYRIANYAGTLTDNGLAIGTLPAGSNVFVQTSVANQVNLINMASALLNFWDGAAGPKFNNAVNGGGGIWQAGTGNDNWADATGAVNAGYDDGAFAIFTGTPGTVTIDNALGAVTASGLQFATGGYTVIGGDLTLTGPQSVIRVGDGTAAGAGYTATIGSAIIGATQLVKTDAGTLVLTGTNSYAGGTAINGGTVRVSADANLGAVAGGLSLNGGTLNTGANMSSARAIDLAGAGTFLTDAGTTLSLGGAVTGTGGLIKSGGGTLVLSGAGSYTGTTAVVAGTLLVNGNQSGATGATSVASGASLGGTGTIGGNVALADGATLTPGAGGAGTLTINGGLSLAAGVTLAWEFGQANVAGGALNDLVDVGGNLVLDGTINVSVPAGGAFDVGVYRVFNYGGTLTDNGLTLGALPAGSDVDVQTSVAGQVNLVNSAGLMLNFWDGAAGPKNNGVINGGNGTWQNSTGNDNWTNTNGAVNAPYSDGAFAVFGGTGGTVTVDNGLGQVTAAGMQFAANGYTLTGNPIALTGPQSVVRVGDGSAAGAGFTATINSALSGSTQLVKTDAGTLVLGGTNSYTGGTLVNGGTLRVSADANLGAASGGVTLDGGTLATSADLTSGRTVTLAGAGTISTADATTFTLGGLLSGPGALTKAGSGSLLLTGDNSGYTGATTVSAGTLAVTGRLGSAVAVNAGSRLEGTGSVGGIANAGIVAPGRDGFGTLTAGSYAGSGGTLEIEAALGGDGSQADRLVIAGGTSGTTAIDVRNRGGLGGQTVEGIKIIDVTGGTSAGTFTLNGDYKFEGSPAVIAGAFGYRLFLGGVSTPADGDWYLRSSLLDAPNQPQTPLYQPGVPLYESYTQTLQTLNRLPTLQQRIGNRQWAGFTNSGFGIWGRMEANRHRTEPAASTTAADLDIDDWMLQLGVDAELIDADSGALVYALTARYGKADARVRSRFGNGKIDTEGYGVGATLTWYGKGGFYADAQAQVTWSYSDLDSGLLGRLADNNDAMGEAFSLEIGQRMTVADGLSVTPQAQIIHSNMRFDRFVDLAGAIVSAGDSDSLLGRLGISLDHQKSWSQANGQTARRHLYGIANIEYEMLDGTRVDVSGTPLLRRDDRLRGELGIGGSYSWGSGRYTIYSEVSGNTALGNFGNSNTLRAHAGFQVTF